MLEFLFIITFITVFTLGVNVMQSKVDTSCEWHDWEHRTTNHFKGLVCIKCNKKVNYN